jgi:gamma-glutamyltranspeptidase / glutathione hydrolase
MSQLGIREGTEVRSRVGAVATAPLAAARIGARILLGGGNAMDAAAAACLACAVLEPESVDIGGYLFCAVVRNTETGKVWSLDANARAPRKASSTMFKVLAAQSQKPGINELAYNCSIENDANIYGPLSVAVPGFVSGVGTLWEKWGRLKWPHIVEGAQALLSDGFCFGPTAAAVARRAEILRRFPPSWEHLAPQGRLPDATDVWHRRGLEKTLERLAVHGWQDFYQGELGRTIARYLQSIGGVLDAEDMAAYAPHISTAYSISYRDAKVFAPSLPNGALTSLEILNLLECFPRSLEDHSALYWHRMGELMKLAWRDRLRYLGDPDFVDVPEALLLDKKYARGRAENLIQFPSSVDRLEPGMARRWSRGTIHVSAADAEGNLVAATISQGHPFGSCVTVPGTGVILGHGISRMDPRPGLPNSIAGGKRPLNNVAPLIVSLPESDIAFGTRGGRQIVNVSAQLAHRFVDSRQGGATVLKAPRLHVRDREPFEFLEFEFVEAVSPKVVERLIELGHAVQRTPDPIQGNGAAHCVEFFRAKGEIRASSNASCAAVE